MRTFIRSSKTTATGYELVTVDENNVENVYPINDQPKNEPYTLILPENPSNRKYFNSKKVDAAGGKIELTYKESRTITKTGDSTPRKGLEDYLEGKDKETYLALVEKAKKAKEAQKSRPLTELEKAERKMLKCKEAYEKLLAENKAADKDAE